MRNVRNDDWWLIVIYVPKKTKEKVVVVFSSQLLKCKLINNLHTPLKIQSNKTKHQSRILPPEWGGGPHSRTTPWPSRTLTGLLLCVLKFSKSVGYRTVKQITKPFLIGNRSTLDAHNRNTIWKIRKSN